MPLKAVLKTISLFLSLAVFLVVCVQSLAVGEELIWAVGKAFVTFSISWIVINWLAGILSMSVEGMQRAPEPGTAQSASENSGNKCAAGAEE